MNLPDEIDELLGRIEIDKNLINIANGDKVIIEITEDLKSIIRSLKKKWETEAYKKGYIQAGIDNLTNGDK